MNWKYKNKMYEYKYLILDASSSQFYFVKCNNKEQLSINKIGSVSHRFTSQGHIHTETTLKVIYSTHRDDYQGHKSHRGNS